MNFQQKGILIRTDRALLHSTASAYFIFTHSQN
ncbi:Uncharacterised protein [Bacteroides heparinolyticus]|uniref:Uncharacterized protein n=1 Tax=Prevotella heparinolytica TaxID=28113 RepID=A0A449I212_9BACE|nr:Uncharacterised protein [Bacteroides heparinolyticus]